jgi:hypothetical protein
MTLPEGSEISSNMLSLQQKAKDEFQDRRICSRAVALTSFMESLGYCNFLTKNMDFLSVKFYQFWSSNSFIRISIETNGDPQHCVLKLKLEV